MNPGRLEDGLSSASSLPVPEDFPDIYGDPEEYVDRQEVFSKARALLPHRPYTIDLPVRSLLLACRWRGRVRVIPCGSWRKEDKSLHPCMEYRGLKKRHLQANKYQSCLSRSAEDQKVHLCAFFSRKLSLVEGRMDFTGWGPWARRP